jgi:hypothetical protein
MLELVQRRAQQSSTAKRAVSLITLSATSET